jgi:protein-S-isoprenylcysteine O-methyltransferase Ste14
VKRLALIVAMLWAALSVLVVTVGCCLWAQNWWLMAPLVLGCAFAAYCCLEEAAALAQEVKP